MQNCASRERGIFPSFDRQYVSTASSLTSSHARGSCGAGAGFTLEVDIDPEGVVEAAAVDATGLGAAAASDLAEYAINIKSPCLRVCICWLFPMHDAGAHFRPRWDRVRPFRDLRGTSPPRGLFEIVMVDVSASMVDSMI